LPNRELMRYRLRARRGRTAFYKEGGAPGYPRGCRRCKPESSSTTLARRRLTRPRSHQRN
jgi:hypothetical protein